jgi:hypothetical protein
MLEHDTVRRAPLRGDTSVTANRRRRPKTPASPHIRALQEASTPTATIETIGDLVKLAPRLTTARTMAMLLRRYRNVGARAVALEGAMEENVNDWREYDQPQAEIAMGK